MPVADSQKLTVELVTKGTIATGGAGVKPCLNVYHYRRASGTPPINKANIAAKFDALIFAFIAPVLHLSYTCNEIDIRFLEDNLDAYEGEAVSEAGAATGDRAPDYECVTIQLKTNKRGRNYRGSKHFSPLSEAQTDADVIDSAAIPDFITIRDTLILPFSDVDGNTWSPFVWSRDQSTLAGDLWTIAGAGVVEAVLNKTLGTVRSRKPKTVVV